MELLNLFSLFADLLAVSYLLRFLLLPHLQFQQKFWSCFAATLLLTLCCRYAGFPFLELALPMLLYPALLLLLTDTRSKIKLYCTWLALLLLFLLPANLFILLASMLHCDTELTALLAGILLDGLTIFLCRRYRYQLLQPLQITIPEILFCIALNFLTLLLSVLLQPEYHFINTSQPGLSVLLVILTVSIVLLNLFFCLLLLQSRITAHYKWTNQIHQQYMEQALQHFSAYKAQQDTLRRHRHDFKNHLLTLRALYAEQNYTAMGRYLQNLTEQWQETPAVLHRGDSIADAIINGKQYFMRQLQISFTLDGVFHKALPLKPVDICTIFSNALDNAIEANEKISVSQRLIAVQIRQTETFFCITFRNPLPPLPLKKQGALFSSTKTGTEHGFGLFNIQEAVARYHGSMQIETAQQQFVLTITLPMQPFTS